MSERRLENARRTLPADYQFGDMAKRVVNERAQRELLQVMDAERYKTRAEIAIELDGYGAGV